MGFYSKSHYKLVGGYYDKDRSPADKRWRLAAVYAGKLAIAEREQKYPVLSAENADAAMKFQEERHQYHLNLMWEV